MSPAWRTALVSLAIAGSLSAQMAKTGLVKALPRESNALGWQSGAMKQAMDNDCIDLNGGYNVDTVISTFVSYYGDPNASVPKVGDVYYADIYAQSLAICQPSSAWIYFIPPANTQLAISAQYPVYCLKDGVQITNGCTQAPQLQTTPNNNSGYAFGGWSLHQVGLQGGTTGGSIEIQIPVISTSTATTTLYAEVDDVNGWTNPSLFPSMSLIPGAASPSISYPSPSSSLITDTSARTTADIFNRYIAGSLYFDLGTTTSYGTSTAATSVPNTGNGFEYYTDWSALNPGTTYHWRARFVYGGGTTVNGADQTFTTTGSVSLPGTPNGVRANAVAGGIDVTWNVLIGASSYDVYRRDAGSATYNKIGSAAGSIYHDTTVTAGSAHLYEVRAVNGAGAGNYSLPDLAAAVVFTDDPLVTIDTAATIKAVHLTELRTAVDGVRALAGLAAGTYSAATAGSVVRATHINELRTQLDAALSILGYSTGGYTNTIATGVVIRGVDFQEIRTRVR